MGERERKKELSLDYILQKVELCVHVFSWEYVGNPILLTHILRQRA